jgi:hypothetical protein
VIVPETSATFGPDSQPVIPSNKTAVDHKKGDRRLSRISELSFPRDEMTLQKQRQRTVLSAVDNIA